MSKKAKTSINEKTTGGRHGILRGYSFDGKSSMGTAMEKPIEMQKKK